VNVIKFSKDQILLNTREIRIATGNRLIKIEEGDHIVVNKASNCPLIIAGRKDIIVQPDGSYMCFNQKCNGQLLKICGSNKQFCSNHFIPSNEEIGNIFTGD